MPFLANCDLPIVQEIRNRQCVFSRGLDGVFEIHGASMPCSSMMLTAKSWAEAMERLIELIMRMESKL